MKNIQLLPLAQSSLSSQLFKLTGKYYSSQDFERITDGAQDLETGQKFIFASLEAEESYKKAEEKRQAAEEIRLSHVYDNYKGFIIDLNNSERWRTGLNHCLKNGVTEMTEDSYWHFLECVPPKVMKFGGYVSGEPNHHNSKDQPVYICGIEKDGKFWAQYGTTQEFLNKEMFKTFPE